MLVIGISCRIARSGYFAFDWAEAGKAESAGKSVSNAIVLLFMDTPKRGSMITSMRTIARLGRVLYGVGAGLGNFSGRIAA
jgi:hypothetical protein